MSLNQLGEKSQAIIILGKFVILTLLAYSFRKMFFIGQNSKHVRIRYSFLELLIFFWLTLVNIYCLEFISHYIKEILYINTNFETSHKQETLCVVTIAMIYFTILHFEKFNISGELYITQLNIYDAAFIAKIVSS